MYEFSVRWNFNTQTIYYSSLQNINFPINITVREYKSNATIWSVPMTAMDANVEYWMIPAEKQYMDYESMDGFTGIKFCVYNAHTNEQIYEQPFFRKFYNLHTTNLSNTNPYYHNYVEYFVYKVYDKWLNKKYGLVVDVGANVGVFTECMLHLYNCEQVVAVECNKNLVSDLRQSYQHDTRVTIIDKALHHTNTEVSFYQCDSHPGISTITSPEQMNNNTGIPFSQVISVETITIRDIVDKFGNIDLLKLDIEGAEYDVLINAEDGVFNSINNLFIECHFFNENHKYKDEYLALVNKLKSTGYIVEESYADQVNIPCISECIYAHRP